MGVLPCHLYIYGVIAPALQPGGRPHWRRAEVRNQLRYCSKLLTNGITPYVFKGAHLSWKKLSN